jgi:hypothetical protein
MSVINTFLEYPKKKKIKNLIINYKIKELSIGIYNMWIIKLTLILCFGGEEVGATNCNCYYYYTINTYDRIILDYITIGYK